MEKSVSDPQIQSALLDRAPSSASPRADATGVSPIRPKRVPAVVMLAAFVVCIWGIAQAHTFLAPLAFAALLALLMMPLIRILQKRGFPEWLIVICSSVILIAPVVLAASLLVTEGRSLARDWPQLHEAVSRNFDNFLSSSLAKNYDLRDQLSGESIAEKFGEKAGEGVRWALLSLTKVFSVGSHLILVLFFAIVMIASRNQVRESFERLIGHAHSRGKVKTLDAATEVLEKFLAARIFIILFVALADFIILKCFGIPYAATLSLVLGVMTLVPVLGFFIGVGPVLLVSLARGETPLSMLGVFLSVGAISSLQDHILAPKLIGQKLNLNFLATYVAIFAGERLWGISGMFLAVPVLGVTRILLNASDDHKTWGHFLEARQKGRTDERPTSRES